MWGQRRTRGFYSWTERKAAFRHGGRVATRRERLWGGTGGGDGNQEAQEVMWTGWASSGVPGTQNGLWALPGDSVLLTAALGSRKGVFLLQSCFLVKNTIDLGHLGDSEFCPGLKNSRSLCWYWTGGRRVWCGMWRCSMQVVGSGPQKWKERR